MVVYVVTGASRGLGYEFVCQLSRNADNIVFGLARNKEATEKKVATDGLKNVHIVSADINDHKSLQAAKADIEKQTSVVDVLINNAAYMNPKTQFVGLTDFEKDPDVLYDDLMVNFQTNVIGVVKVTNTFLPMIRKSKVRKVITISTGLADDTFTNGYNIFEAAPYSISKAALNTVVAKYNAQHGKSSDGILFLAISPGLVDTGSDGVRKLLSILSLEP